MSFTSWPRLAVSLARAFGVRDGGRRLVHEGRRRFDRFELGATLAPPPTGNPPASPTPNSTALGSQAAAEAKERADRVAAGEHEAYGGTWRSLPGTAADWNTNPTTGLLQGSPDDAWWKIPTRSPAGDIKDVWEPARFSWAYDLVRGYALTGDDHYRESFFSSLAKWYEASPPFRGPHWGCGQETSIRAIALTFAEAGFEPLTQDERGLIDTILFQSGERVADAIGYAISQRNNHGISEATGLIVLGARFADRSEAAAGWLARGQRILEELIPKQFEPDGWYIQHSFNYLRVALHQCVMAEWTLRTRQRRLGSEATDRLRAATRLLKAVMTSADGRVPHYGSDDGANVLPVSLASYHDFRPVLSLACAVFDEPYPADQDLDHEALAWLGLPPPRREPGAGDGLRSGPSGWAVGRLGRCQFFFRAGRNRSRPGQIDPLQVELWVDGEPAVIDPGTFSYANHGTLSLASFEAHNSPKVDGYVAAIAGPRFLALKWPTSRLLDVRSTGDAVTAVGEIPDVVRRTVQLSADGLEVVDEPLQAGAAMHVNWLLHPDSPVAVTFDGGTEAPQRDGEDAPDWFAPTYGIRVTGRYYEGRLTPSNRQLISRFSLPA